MDMYLVVFIAVDNRLRFNPIFIQRAGQFDLPQLLPGGILPIKPECHYAVRGC